MTVRPFNGDTTPMINDLGDGTHRAVLDAATSGPVNLRPFSGDTTPQINDLGDGVHREVVEIVGDFGESTPGLTIDAATTVTDPGAGDFVPISNNGEPGKVAFSWFASAAALAAGLAAAATSLATGLATKLDTTAAPELIRDTMGTALVAGFGAGLVVNDPSDTITVSAVTDVLPPRSGGWLASGSGNTSAAIMSVSGRIFYVPIIIPSPCTIDRIGIHVHTGAASTNARLGIYGSTATRLPGTKIADCASAISTATAGRLEGTFTVNPVLAAGLYWLAWQSDSAGFTLQPRVITQAALIWVQNSIGTLNYSGEDNATCVEAGNYASGLPTTATPSISLGSDGGSHIRSPVMAVRVV